MKIITDDKRICIDFHNKIRIGFLKKEILIFGKNIYFGFLKMNNKLKKVTEKVFLIQIYNFQLMIRR